MDNKGSRKVGGVGGERSVEENREGKEPLKTFEKAM